MLHYTYGAYVHWCVSKNSLNDPKLVMPGNGPSIWGKHNPSLTLRLNKGKLQCPSRKSLYENRSCAVPHSGVCNHRLQGTNRMTFHSPLSPTVTGWSPGCQTAGVFCSRCVALFTESFCNPSFPLEPPTGWQAFMLVICFCLVELVLQTISWPLQMMSCCNYAVTFLPDFSITSD